MVQTPLLDGLVGAFSLVPNAVATLDAMRVLLRCVICAHNLLQFLPGARPLVQLVGPPGTGKTMLARLVGKIISGLSWDVIGVPVLERDFWPVIALLHPVGLDNVESLPPWLPDALARATSGVGHHARKLYTDDEVVVFKCKSFIWVTNFSGSVLRGDLLDRTLGLRFGPLEQRLSELQMLATLEQRRGEFLAELGAVKHAVEACVAQNGLPSPSDVADRLADFIALGRVIAFVMGGESAVALFNIAMAAMRVERLLLAASDPTTAALLDWARSPHNRDVDGAALWISARALLSRLAEAMGGDNGFDATARNAAWLGKFLMDLQVKAAGILRIETKTVNGMRLYRVTLAVSLPKMAGE